MVPWDFFFCNRKPQALRSLLVVYKAPLEFPVRLDLFLLKKWSDL